MSETNGGVTASVQVLTAEVRTLMVGSRQVTMSVYKQLDCVPGDELEPFGRVSFGECSQLWVVGRRIATGALARSFRNKPELPYSWKNPRGYPNASDLFIVGPSKHNGCLSADWAYVDACRYRHGEHVMERGEIPERPRAALIASRGQYKYVLWIPLDARMDSKVTPGHWDYADTAARAELEAAAAESLDSIHQEVSSYDEWVQLPLIVLAGLR